MSSTTLLRYLLERLNNTPECTSSSSLHNYGRNIRILRPRVLNYDNIELCYYSLHKSNSKIISGVGLTFRSFCSASLILYRHIEAGRITALKSCTKAMEEIEGLRNYKHDKISLVPDSIIGKNKRELKGEVQFYKGRKCLSPSLKQKSVQKCHSNKQLSSSLDSWANLLVNLYGLENLQTDIATAFRLIAYFESKPPAACTDNIDFRKVYLIIADAIEGKTIPNDMSIKCILNKCIKETALTSEALIKSSKYKNIIKSINLTEREKSSFIKPTANMELVTLRHLLNQKSYNPLYFTEECLIPTVQP